MHLEHINLVIKSFEQPARRTNWPTGQLIFPTRD